MDLWPLIVLAVIIALVAFSMSTRVRRRDDGSSDLRPPGEPGNSDRTIGGPDV
jgi:hypothetical protein